MIRVQILVKDYLRKRNAEISNPPAFQVTSKLASKFINNIFLFSLITVNALSSSILLGILLKGIPGPLYSSMSSCNK